MRMKIGVTTLLMAKACPDEHDRIRKFAGLGFEALDYAYHSHKGADSLYLKNSWEEYACSLRETADHAGICFSQLHGPVLPYGSSQEEETLHEELMVRAFRVCELLGAPYLVLHPRMRPDCINGENAKRDLDRNVELFRRLLPLAERHGVKIALENMWGWDPAVKRICRTTFSTVEEILECLDRLDSEWAVACLDTGHYNLIRESPAGAARKLGKHLKVLHVHDNHGIDDDHMAPFYGHIRWQEFLTALSDIGYGGVFSSEAHGMTNHLPKEAEADGARLLYTITDALLRTQE